MDTTEQAREQAGTKAGDAGRTAVDDEAVGPVPTGTYVVDPVHSSIGFAVVHERTRLIVTVARVSCSHSEHSTAHCYDGSRHGEAFAPI